MRALMTALAADRGGAYLDGPPTGARSDDESEDAGRLQRADAARILLFVPVPLNVGVSLPSLAFVGLGAIGAPMAAHLAEGGGLTVWNRTMMVAERFAARHRARVAATPREAAASAEIVVTC